MTELEHFNSFILKDFEIHAYKSHVYAHIKLYRYTTAYYIRYTCSRRRITIKTQGHLKCVYRPQNYEHCKISQDNALTLESQPTE